MKFNIALNVLAVTLMGVLGASVHAQSVIPVKGSSTVDQLKQEVKGKPLPSTNQAAQEAKLNPSASTSQAASQSLFPAQGQASNPSDAQTKPSVSAPASQEDASKEASKEASKSAPASTSTQQEGLSGIPFQANTTDVANTLANVSDLQAQLALQKISFEVDKQIQARKDFANGISKTGGSMGGSSKSQAAEVAAPPPSKPKVISVSAFGDRQSAEILLGDGSKYVLSPGGKLPNGMRVGRVHDGGVDLISGKHASFYPVTPGVASYRPVGAGASSGVQSTAMPAGAIPSPSMPPVALPPMPGQAQ